MTPTGSRIAKEIAIFVLGAQIYARLKCHRRSIDAIHVGSEPHLHYCSVPAEIVWAQYTSIDFCSGRSRRCGTKHTT